MNEDEQIEETLSPEELAELMREYKKDLARIYRTASARRVQILRMRRALKESSGAMRHPCAPRSRR